MLRVVKLGESFFGVRHVRLVCAAKLKQPLLTPQVGFCEFELSLLAFSHGCFRSND